METPMPTAPKPSSNDQPLDLDDAEIAAASRSLGEQLLAGQTPQQREIAEQIYHRLRAGAEVDDIKDLIGDLAYTATVDQRRREQERHPNR
jgi:hypothetical protein